MLDSRLRYPHPQVSRISERWIPERGDGRRRQWGEERCILPDNYRSALPVKPRGGGSQTGKTGSNTIRGGWKSPEKIKVQFSTRPCSREIRPIDFKPELRLTCRCAEVARCVRGSTPQCEVRHILIIYTAPIGKGVEQDHSSKPHPVLRRAFDFGLVLFLDFAFQELVILLDLIQPLGRQLWEFCCGNVPAVG